MISGIVFFKFSFQQMVPTLVRTLKTLVTTGYSPDHEVNKINDPFLQVQIRNLSILSVFFFYWTKTS